MENSSNEKIVAEVVEYLNKSKDIKVKGWRKVEERVEQFSNDDVMYSETYHISVQSALNEYIREIFKERKSVGIIIIFNTVYSGEVIRRHTGLAIKIGDKLGRWHAPLTRVEGESHRMSRAEELYRIALIALEGDTVDSRVG